MRKWGDRLAIAGVLFWLADCALGMSWKGRRPFAPDAVHTHLAWGVTYLTDGDVALSRALWIPAAILLLIGLSLRALGKPSE
jgi:hypothetical protein